MSDETLRKLERAFRASGSPDDEAAWLLERLRVDLARPRLEIAALCGHPGALEARRRSPPPRATAADVLGSYFDLASAAPWIKKGCPVEGKGKKATADIVEVIDWCLDKKWSKYEGDASLGSGRVLGAIVAAVRSLDPDAGLRAMVTLLRLTGPLCDSPAAAEAASRFVVAVERWALGDRGVGKQVQDAAKAMGSSSMRAGEPSVRVNQAISLVAELVVSDLGKHVVLWARAATQLFRALHAAGGEKAPLTDQAIVDQTREALRAEVVPWALGYGDPLRDRVAMSS
jgi:hypothetical protein